MFERLLAASWPQRCPECRAPMTLTRDEQVRTLPTVFEDTWACLRCGETARRARVFEVVH